MPKGSFTRVTATETLSLHESASVHLRFFRQIFFFLPENFFREEFAAYAGSAAEINPNFTQNAIRWQKETGFLLAAWRVMLRIVSHQPACLRHPFPELSARRAAARCARQLLTLCSALIHPATASNRGPFRQGNALRSSNRLILLKVKPAIPV